MKKLFIYGLLLFGFSSVLTSCMPKDDLIYSGPAVAEFKNHLFGRVAASLPAGVVSGATNVALGRRIRVTTRVTDTIFVQLVGPQFTSAVNIPFTIGAASTAVEGTHYNFVPTGARSVTIPANSSVGYILTKPVATSVTGTATFPLILNLGSSDQVKASENYKTFTLTFAN